MSSRRPGRADSHLSDARTAARLLRAMRLWKLCLEVSAEVGVDAATVKRAVRHAERCLGGASDGKRSRWGVWSAALRDAGETPEQIRKAGARYIAHITRTVSAPDPGPAGLRHR